MKANYIGLQNQIGKPPIVLVNVEYSYGVTTEALTNKHDISVRDYLLIDYDLKEWRNENL